MRPAPHVSSTWPCTCAEPRRSSARECCTDTPQSQPLFMRQPRLGWTSRRAAAAPGPNI
jgi:hypothetical protein